MNEYNYVFFISLSETKSGCHIQKYMEKCYLGVHACSIGVTKNKESMNAGLYSSSRCQYKTFFVVAAFCDRIHPIQKVGHWLDVFENHQVNEEVK